MTEKVKTWYVPVGESKVIRCLPPPDDLSWMCYNQEVIRVRWLIGGKLTSTDQEFIHTFEQPGVYWVTAKVYDEKYRLLDKTVGKVIAELGPPWSPEVLEQNPGLAIRVNSARFWKLQKKP